MKELGMRAFLTRPSVCSLNPLLLETQCCSGELGIVISQHDGDKGLIPGLETCLSTPALLVENGSDKM